ncbi:MAG: M1 family metallopeptidase [Bacteroidetes bacterium]|nr:M1 family metallopeptidase [Bacteroidota bacterium]
MRYILISLFSLSLLACQYRNKPNINASNHSFSNYNEVKVNHLNLFLDVKFGKKEIWGTATLKIRNEAKAHQIILDTKGLSIDHVAAGAKNKLTETTFTLGPEDSILGRALIIPITDSTTEVSVAYHTLPASEALQWLSPEQTHDKKHPFLFSQSEAILARSWIPLMDVPAHRFTYEATVKVPKELMALMSATNPTVRNDSGLYHFRQERPIPSYLIALAVGDVGFKPLGRNTGVYAETGFLDSCAWELQSMQAMVDSAEALYGPYAWGRYDLLVLPPSFPFGGMENPCLTFATPTIIAGDRSLVSLVAHELAHSWSGNLVTTATWNDFWLNEGFTVYFEQRIMEKVYGQKYAEMLAALGRGELDLTLKELMADPARRADTRLRLNLDGRNPDDGMSDIAYEKGRFFLRHLEQTTGRRDWDRFLKNYFSDLAFKSTTTSLFLDKLNKELLMTPELHQKADVRTWVYGEGLPAYATPVVSEELERVNADLAMSRRGFTAMLNHMKPETYTTHHWLHFLRNLHTSIDAKGMKVLDDRFHFTQSGNAEIQCDWYQLAIKHQYKPAYPALEQFLKKVGRRKFLMPLYKALIQTPEGKKWALDIFRQARSGYHSVSANSVEELLQH